MNKEFNLKRTKQCKNCPWRIDTNPFDIPGYSKKQHIALEKTISQGLEITGVVQTMACHQSKEGNEEACIGWLENQIGRGNNISLRISMLKCKNGTEIRTFGKQHERFEDTLPKINQ